MARAFEEKKIKKSEGKLLGRVAFWISEILVIMSVISILIDVFNGNGLNAQMMGNIFLFQGTIFTVSWGAKATSNFAKRKAYDDEKGIS
jgi:hypothetical protein